MDPIIVRGLDMCIGRARYGLSGIEGGLRIFIGGARLVGNVSTVCVEILVRARGNGRSWGGRVQRRDRGERIWGVVKGRRDFRGARSEVCAV